MSETPSFPELIELVAERSAALREAVAVAADLDVRVPGCPDWSLRDLVAHLGAVQRFWAVVVAAGPAEGPPTPEALGDREPRGDLLEWSAESTNILLAALHATDPELSCWAWWGASAAPMTVAAVARHQVQEAAVHAYDAQESIGKPEPLPAAVAIDGVPEFLEVGVGAQGAWPHRPARLAFSATEGQVWVLQLTPSGARIDPAPGEDPVATLSGQASDLILVGYGRAPLERLRITGDRVVVEQFLTWTNTE
jgi:uncharacterized protein (TIGR03083 family)